MLILKLWDEISLPFANLGAKKTRRVSSNHDATGHWLTTCADKLLANECFIPQSIHHFEKIYKTNWTIYLVWPQTRDWPHNITSKETRYFRIGFIFLTEKVCPCFMLYGEMLELVLKSVNCVIANDSLFHVT